MKNDSNTSIRIILAFGINEFLDFLAAIMAPGSWLLLFAPYIAVELLINSLRKWQAPFGATVVFWIQVYTSLFSAKKLLVLQCVTK